MNSHDLLMLLLLLSPGLLLSAVIMLTFAAGGWFYRFHFQAQQVWKEQSEFQEKIVPATVRQNRQNLTANKQSPVTSLSFTGEYICIKKHSIYNSVFLEESLCFSLWLGFRRKGTELINVSSNSMRCSIWRKK